MAQVANSIGHQQLTVSSTSVGLTLPTGKQPNHALIQCGATGAVRWRADGTAPTATVGMYLGPRGVIDFTGMSNYSALISNIRFFAESADTTLDIEYFG